MSLVLELTPELEQQVRDEAARQGQPVEQYALTALRRGLAPADAPPARPFYETATPEEWEREFDAWTASHSDIDAPVIPLEALRRENLYATRG